MFDQDPNRKGNVAELAIAAEAARLGLHVYKPLTEHGRTDLVMEVVGRLFRVQCKWASLSRDVIQVRLNGSRHSPTRGYVTSTYGSDDVDALAVYCGDLNRCYLVPIERVAGLMMFSLRLAAARNNQQAALNWAADYEFPGAVAQLAERSDGIRKVRGSIPLSSTPLDETESSVESVGAHEFRNRFGLYLQRAAGGREVLISRRGRPYARLCPPKPAASA